MLKAQQAHRYLTLVVLLVVTTLGLTLAPTPARADEARPITKRLAIEMVRVGVDHAIAEANGFEVRVDSKGVEFAVPKGSSPGLDNEVPGPCGWSFVYWINVDWFRHSATIYTGFEIQPGWQPAISVPNWITVVTDNYGVSTREHGPNFDVIAPAHHWDGKRLGFTAGGPTGAWVDLTYGLAILRDGTFCWSLNPWAYVDL